MGLNHVTLKHEKGKHLTKEERLFIQKFHNMDWSYYDLAVELGCSYNTIRNEMKRGDYRDYGLYWLDYNAWRGQQNYEKNRSKCHRPCKLGKCRRFVEWALKKIKGSEKWSIDAAVGHAKLKHLFPADEIPNTKTMYNWVNKGLIELRRHELPEAKKRKPRAKKVEYTQKQPYLGKSIEERPEIVNSREEFGHWEIDTVIGQRDGKHEVLLTMTERKTRMEIIKKISAKTKEAVRLGICEVLGEYHQRKFQIFKTITADNGLEFAGLPDEENEAFKIYFAHPYSSYERGTNERHNRIIRRVIPKGKNIDEYSDFDIEDLEDWMNNLPRKVLGYQTPAQLFEAELDKIFRKTA